jgi:hypothetical protein
MKNLKVIICFLFLALQGSIYSQNEVVIGKIDSVQSKILEENRKLMVYVPNGGSDSKSYPVIYLLDGDGHFTSVVGMIEHLSNNSIIPQMMVVAIPNTNRTRDLTPTKAEPNPPMVPEGLSEQSGGGKNFLSFIEKELFPYIDKNYPTASYRMFIGHSFGGLFVMDALQDKPHLFQSYISIDPSMWWDNKLLLNSFKTTDFSDDKYKNKALYMGIANTLEQGMDTISVKKANGPMVDHINSIFETRNVLRKMKNDNLNFKSKYYENDNHGSAPLITTYDGLRFIFEFYQFEVQFSDVMKPNTDVVARMKTHYSDVSGTLGYENKPNEGMINGMGYQLMEMDKLDLAGEFFKMNIDYYPKSSNVYDSLGDYYLATENKEKAKLSFEKALSIEENPESRKKLNQLKSD